MKATEPNKMNINLRQWMTMDPKVWQTIHLKATGQYFPVVLLFIILKGVGWISILIIILKRVAKKTTILKFKDFWSKHF